MTPIPQKVKNNLLAGGTNISFPFYDYNESQIAMFRAALPEMKQKGIRNVRITISMNTIEDVAKTGKLRDDRWAKILDFMLALIALDITPIFDNHNTGIRGDDDAGDWTSDYMGDLRTAAVRTRHINLMKAVAVKIQTDTRLVNEVVFTYANEPIFDRSSSDAAIWWNHQKALVPAIRAVAPDVIMTYMAQDWNGLEAFVGNWDAQMKAFADPAKDPRLIADIHFYEPVESFTHVANATNKYPGTLNSWRGTNTWNKAFMRGLIKPLSDFAKAKNLPLVFISEYGTDKRADKESRLRYMTDLSDIFREFGFGHSAYTWSYGDSFQINGIDDRIWAAVTEPVTTEPPPDEEPPPDDDPPPVEDDALSEQERAAVAAMITAALIDFKASLKVEGTFTVK